MKRQINIVILSVAVVVVSLVGSSVASAADGDRCYNNETGQIRLCKDVTTGPNTGWIKAEGRLGAGVVCADGSQKIVACSSSSAAFRLTEQNACLDSNDKPVASCSSAGAFRLDPNHSKTPTPSATTEGGDDTSCIILPAEWCSSEKIADDSERGGRVFALLRFVLAIMTAGVGVIAVAAIVWAGILYSSAKDNAQQVQKAKDVILQVVIGILLFAAMGLIINFLIPGGVIG